MSTYLPFTFPVSNGHFPLPIEQTLFTEAVREVALTTQAPVPMIYLSMLSVASAALQGMVQIQLPTGNVRPVSLATMSIAESGERKSTVENLITRGMRIYLEQQEKALSDVRIKYELEKELHEGRIQKLKIKMFKSSDEEEAILMGRLLDLIKNEHTPPKKAFIFLEDVTPEALVKELSSNRPNALISSSEGGLVFGSRAMSKTSVLSSLWSGDDITVNRKGAGETIVKSPTFAMNIMVQWDPVKRFLDRSKYEIRGNGFLARLLICAPISTCGVRWYRESDNTTELLDSFNERVLSLLSLLTEQQSQDVNKATVRFSQSAKQAWIEVSNDIEMHMQPEGRFCTARDHASKLVENISRVAAVLHCFENEFEEEVSLETLKEAINIVSYYSGEFMRIFNPPPRYVFDAENLTAWLRAYIDKGFRYVRRTDILRYGPAGTRKKRDLDDALNYLTSLGYLICYKVGRYWILDLYPRHEFDSVKFQQDIVE
ncbi:YfjI family protein [Vibrio breoganii]